MFPGVVISTCFCVLFTIISIGLPIFIIVFYLRKSESWNEEKFTAKYGTILEPMFTNKKHEFRGKDYKWAIFFIMLFLIRRIVFATVVIFTPEYLFLHIFFLFAFTTTGTIYLLSN